MEAHHADHPIRTHHLSLAFKRSADKDIAREEGKLNKLSAILPAGEDFADRKKGLHLAPHQLLGNRLFMTGPSIEGIPPFNLLGG